MSENLRRNKHIVINALLHYSYRCVCVEDNEYIFGKPVGYGILKASIQFLSLGIKIEIALIVKGSKQDNSSERPNLLWKSITSELTDKDLDADGYATVVQYIADKEAQILKSPLDFRANRHVRYDFNSNTRLLVELLYS